MIEYQDLVKHLSVENTKLCLSPTLWSNIDSNTLQTVQRKDRWVTFKYLNEDGTLNKDGIKLIDRNKGGIYVYYVSPEIIPERQRIMMYIGRAHKSPSENLRARVSSYYRFFRKYDIKRPRISTLFANWGKYIFCSFLELDDNQTIDSVEKGLINALLPPCNSSIPNMTISAAVKAVL